MPTISLTPILMGEALGKAVKDALDMAGIHPEEIDYINPHGTSTLLNDRVETRMLKGVFGNRLYHIPNQLQPNQSLAI